MLVNKCFAYNRCDAYNLAFLVLLFATDALALHQYLPHRYNHATVLFPIGFPMTWKGNNHMKDLLDMYASEAYASVSDLNF